MVLRTAFSLERSKHILLLLKIAFSAFAGYIEIHIRQRIAPDENPPHGLYFHHPSAIQAFEGTPEVIESLMIHIHFLAAQKALYFHRSILPIPSPISHVLLARTPALLGRRFENP
jgi:hypothetical protein